VYKFQTSRGPDPDAEGVEGGRQWGGGAPLPSRLGVWKSVVSSPSGVWVRAMTENEFWHILELVKNTPDRHKSRLSFLTFLGDLAGRIETPGRPDCGPGPYVGHSCVKLKGYPKSMK